ncbi:MAG: peptidylprolyl isomerase [Myxococcales bacterium]|nr:peptidylprolyl isomerase [Myxococcales bacterium]
MRISLALALALLACPLGCIGKQPPKADQTAPAGPQPGLLDPTQANEQAPDLYKVELDTTKGKVVIEVHRDWAPKGADRFYNLVKVGFFDQVAFFRAIDGFMVQFGMSGNPAAQQAWNEHPLEDDPVKESNTPGMVTFAKKGIPNSRTTQVFINYGNNANLDPMGFAPFGKVVEGMDVVQSFYTGYGEGAPRGKGPNQMLMEKQGNPYLEKQFPKLDWLRKATIVEG